MLLVPTPVQAVLSSSSVPLSEHIDYAIVAEPHPPMYLLHKWWARKPHNVVRHYIEHYTAPDDLVLDPFHGSGPTVLESIRLGRRAIGFDLDPLLCLWRE